MTLLLTISYDNISKVLLQYCFDIDRILLIDNYNTSITLIVYIQYMNI